MNELLLYTIILVWAISRYYWYFNQSDSDVSAEFSNLQFNEYDAVLNEHMPYYSKLSAAAKARFIGRLVYVMKQVPVIGREGFEVTTREKVLILGSLTQLTFGFKSPRLPFLKGIVVYAGVFYSRLLNANVKGLSMGNGMVFLSYDDFIEGYKDSTDTYNLGLHEFAHVLRFQAAEVSLFDERLTSYFDEWEELGTPVFLRTRSRQEDFFRAYGGTNPSEFFSVCVENFFEVPELFKQELPELYYHLCYLLKQNPLNMKGDYEFDADEVAEANLFLEKDLPVYKLWNSQGEHLFLHTIDNFIWAAGIIGVLLFMEANTPVQLYALRVFGVSTIIFFGVRSLYYRNIRAVLNSQYLGYFFSKLAPAMVFSAVVYAIYELVT